MINSDGTWKYDLDSTLMVRGRTEPFHHTDRNVLTKVGEPKLNPLAQAADRARSVAAAQR
jgi:hypothetical protein